MRGITENTALFFYFQVWPTLYILPPAEPFAIAGEADEYRILPALAPGWTQPFSGPPAFRAGWCCRAFSPLCSSWEATEDATAVTALQSFSLSRSFSIIDSWGVHKEVFHSVMGSWKNKPVINHDLIVLNVAAWGSPWPPSPIPNFPLYLNNLCTVLLPQRIHLTLYSIYWGARQPKSELFSAREKILLILAEIFKHRIKYLAAWVPPQGYSLSSPYLNFYCAPFASGQFVRKPAGRICIVLPECHDLESLGQAEGASDGVHSPGDWTSSAVNLSANSSGISKWLTYNIPEWENFMPLFPNKAVVTHTDNLCSQSDL